MTKISIYTNDDFLYRKIVLSAPSDAVILRGSEDADIIIADIDTAAPPTSKHMTMSRHGNADISIPFRLGMIKELVLQSQKKSAELSVDKELRTVHLHGEKIKLTEVEFSLLSCLYDLNGEYADREYILKTVWGDGVDAGILNVYIHYLREKLEGHGEKIIISSRKCGYKIDKKYLGGEADA